MKHVNYLLLIATLALSGCVAVCIPRCPPRLCPDPTPTPPPTVTPTPPPATPTPTPPPVTPTPPPTPPPTSPPFDTSGIPTPGTEPPTNCLAEVPQWAEHLDATIDSNCNFIVDGIKFRVDENRFNGTIEGRKNPYYGDTPDVWENCNLENYIEWNVVRQNAEPGGDLLNPGGFGFINHFVAKNFLWQGTKHLSGGHEDLFQPYQGIHGWIVLQDGLARNADENGMVNVGSASNGFGNGPESDWRCPTPDAATDGVLFQNVTIGPNEPGYNGNLQIGFGSGEPIAALWLVELHLKQSLGVNVADNFGKIIVVGGSGARFGWPGSLSPRYTTDEITEATCTPGGWINGECCPNGLVNTANQRFSYRNGQDVNDDYIPVYCYDSNQNALADHEAPPFLNWSSAGWRQTSKR